MPVPMQSSETVAALSSLKKITGFPSASTLAAMPKSAPGGPVSICSGWATMPPGKTGDTSISKLVVLLAEATLMSGDEPAEQRSACHVVQVRHAHRHRIAPLIFRNSHEAR